jgi:hypothetical protein
LLIGSVKLKKNARTNKDLFYKTGGGEYQNKALSELDNRLLRLYGFVSVVGCMDLPDEIHPQHAATDEVVTSELPSLDQPDLIVEKENLPGTSTSNIQFNTSSKLSSRRISNKSTGLF